LLDFSTAKNIAKLTGTMCQFFTILTHFKTKVFILSANFSGNAIGNELAICKKIFKLKRPYTRKKWIRPL